MLNDEDSQQAVEILATMIIDYLKNNRVISEETVDTGSDVKYEEAA